jgi:hypothetical protein
LLVLYLNRLHKALQIRIFGAKVRKNERNAKEKDIIFFISVPSESASGKVNGAKKCKKPSTRKGKTHVYASWRGTRREQSQNKAEKLFLVRQKSSIFVS